MGRRAHNYLDPWVALGMLAQRQKETTGVPRTETNPGAKGRGSHKGIPKDSLNGTVIHRENEEGYTG